MRRAEPGKAISWLHGAPTAADERLHMVVRDPRASVLAMEVTGQGFVRVSTSFGASPVSKYELRFPKIVAMRGPTPGVDLERIVGLRVYQELGEAAVLAAHSSAERVPVATALVGSAGAQRVRDALAAASGGGGGRCVA